VRGLTAFRSAVRDKERVDEKFTVRTVELDLEPQTFSAKDVKDTRALVGVSQGVFAQILGVSANTVQAWEQGLRTPSNMAARFIEEIRAHPEHWKQRLREAAVELSERR
jgi:putative transcriptional regulator